jgi:hypothetical protein
MMSLQEFTYCKLLKPAAQPAAEPVTIHAGRKNCERGVRMSSYFVTFAKSAKACTICKKEMEKRRGRTLREADESRRPL